MIINHNASAQFASRELGITQKAIQGNSEKLSSGERINQAADDASGMAVSERMRAQIRGLNQADRNIQDGISFIQTSEGYLEQTNDILQRVRELSVQSANGIYGAEDRMQIQVEVSQLVDEVNRIASHAQFNGMNMMTGAFSADMAEEDGGRSMQLQVGANMDQNEQIYIGTMTAAALGLTGQQEEGAGAAISISTPENANTAIGAVDSALEMVNRQRADLGAYQSRFEMAHESVTNASQNLQAAESQIRDTDMASEMVDFTKNQILTQTTQSMLAQANTQPQGVMQLLG